jgi:hypothetical protein
MHARCSPAQPRGLVIRQAARAAPPRHRAPWRTRRRSALPPRPQVCLRRRRHKDLFELTHVSASAVVVKSLQTGARTVVKSQSGAEIEKVRGANQLHDGRRAAGAAAALQAPTAAAASCQAPVACVWPRRRTGSGGRSPPSRIPAPRAHP